MKQEILFSSTLWLYPGIGSWHFFTVPTEAGEELRLIGDVHKNSFGSIKVQVTIEDETWATSVFPDKRTGSYLLPVKKSVRDRLKLVAGSTVNIKLVVQE